MALHCYFRLLSIVYLFKLTVITFLLAQNPINCCRSKLNTDLSISLFLCARTIIIKIYQNASVRNFNGNSSLMPVLCISVFVILVDNWNNCFSCGYLTCSSQQSDPLSQNDVIFPRMSKLKAGTVISISQKNYWRYKTGLNTKHWHQWFFLNTKTLGISFTVLIIFKNVFHLMLQVFQNFYWGISYTFFYYIFGDSISHTLLR